MGIMLGSYTNLASQYSPVNGNSSFSEKFINAGYCVSVWYAKVSSKTSNIPSRGKLLKQKDKQLKTAVGSPWNWPHSLSPSMTEEAINSRASPRLVEVKLQRKRSRKESTPVAGEKQKPAQITWKTFRPNEAPGKEISSLLSNLQAVPGVMGSQLGWALGMLLSRSHCCSSFSSPIFI